MSFLQPAMLWSLAVLAPLAAIYFLKVRPRRRPTTAYFLWEKILQENRPQSLFRRLRDVWSLLLMMLAAAAVCLALGQPEWSDERKDLVIVIDNSASMAAQEGRGTRLELAKDSACEIVEGLNGNQLAAVATLGNRLTYRSHLTDNPRELVDAICAVTSTGESLDVGALPAEEGGMSHGTRGHRLLLITDGSLDTSKLPPRVELLKVGSPLENVGFVAADMAFVPGSTNRLSLYYQVASTFREPKQFDLTLSRIDDNDQEQLFKVIPLTVAPGSNRPEIFQLQQAAGGRWIARLDAKDALADDNVAYLAVAKPDPISIAVDAADPFFLENSVQAFSQGDGLLQLVAKNAAVVLAKSKTPDAENAIIFQLAGESIWWTELGDEVVPGPARVLVEGHPALRHLDASSITFVGARQLTPPPGSQILVADDRGLPLIFKARHEGRTAVVVNMDPAAADFYFSAWFPVLVHSAATHLANRENPLAAAYRPGDAVPIVGGSDSIVTTVVPPAVGPDRPAQQTRGQWFTDVERLGFYKISNSSATRDVGASVLSAQETLLNNESIESKHDPLSRGRSPAQWLTLLAIVVLSAESVLYHRRKVG
jgi:hypothetical protein